MKEWRIRIGAPLWLIIGLLSLPGSAGAFHSGGVGECDGCHSIHRDQGSPQMHTYLLKGGDVSSTCLNCHQQAGDAGPTTYHVSTPEWEILTQGVPPKQLSPGGDFAWIKKSYTWNTTSGIKSSDGDRHGHNIIANDYNYVEDSTKVVAPGGNYPSSALTCISCHDPHGKYRRNSDLTVTTTGLPIRDSGSYVNSPDPDKDRSVGTYRLLAGNGYFPRALSSAFAFSADPLVAVAPTDYNRSESQSVTRVAYGTNTAQWCRNCHPNIHNGNDSFTHPAPSLLGSDITAYYNSYIKSGVLTGLEGSSYWSLVPFEVGTTNMALLKGIVASTPTEGPSSAEGNPAVSCLTCHRAHAGAWDSITRWNSKTDYIVSNGAYSQEGLPLQPYGQGRSEAEALQGYYQTPASKYNANEPKFCFKCHAQLPP